ncbi:hypothetical protein ACETWP_09860, partial [Arthrobacter halodurans]
MAIEPVDGTAHPVRAGVSGPGSSPEPASVVGRAAGPACPPDSPAAGSAAPGAPGAPGPAACPAGAAPVAVPVAVPRSGAGGAPTVPGSAVGSSMV